MTFWIAAALLTAGLTALLLLPLGRTAPAPAGNPLLAVARDQMAELDRDLAAGRLAAAEAEAARTEVARRALAAGPAAAPVYRRHKWIAAGLALFLPLAALALYLPAGRPDLPAQPLASRDPAPRLAQQQLIAAAAALAERLQTEPGDLEGWLQLGRITTLLGRPAEAAEAYGRAAGLTADPAIRALQGEALVLAADGTVTEEAQRLFAEAAGGPRAMYYLALAKAQAGDDAAALADFQALARASPPDAVWLPMVREQAAALALRLGQDPAQAMPETDAERMAGMVEGLANRLETSPADVEGWAMLGRSYLVLGRAADSAAAYARAIALAPERTDLLTGYADALLAAGTEPQAPELVGAAERLAAADPDDPRALWILGAAAASSGDGERARDLWQRLLDLMQPGTAEYRALSGRLAALAP